MWMNGQMFAVGGHHQNHWCLLLFPSFWLPVALICLMFTENVTRSPAAWETIFEDILGHITTSVKLDAFEPYNPGEKGPQEPRLPTEEEYASIIHELARQVSNTSSVDSGHSPSTLVNLFYSKATFSSSLKLNLVPKLLSNPSLLFKSRSIPTADVTSLNFLSG